MTTHHLSQRRACGLIGITRRGLQRAPAEDRNRELRQRLRELAEERRRWGCPMLYLMLRREGWQANHKRVERLYREEGLSLRRRRRRKRLSHLRVVRERPLAVNQTWAVDFVHDGLINGRRFRAFTVIDEWSRECLAIEVDVLANGRAGKQSPGAPVRRARAAGSHSVRQRSRVPRPGDGSVGLRAWRTAAVHRTGQTDPERLHRIFNAACARSVSMSRSSSRSTTRGARSNSGESNTIANGRIRALATWRPRSSRRKQPIKGTRPSRAPPYYYRARRAVAREKALHERIVSLCEEFPRYGYRRLTQQLRAEGVLINHKRVARIMRENSLQVRPFRRFVRTTDSDHDNAIFPNLAAACSPAGPNESWVADLTYVAIAIRFVFVAVILDS